MELALGDVWRAAGANSGQPPAHSVARGWSIDSRSVNPGDLFFAIHGERTDGHEFVPAVLEKGAAGAVVSRPVSFDDPRLLRVDDTVEALQKLALWARRHWGKPIVAVTGSAGKTTTKDIIASLLAVKLRTGKTVGNFNNHLGLPLSILRLPDDAEVAVLEMGMNHGGEIRALTAIAEPQYAVVTNVGFAHVENFTSIDGVAAAKRELVEGLPASGVAILNADDERVAAFGASHPGPVLTYGFKDGASVQATDLCPTASGASFVVNGVHFETSLPGQHNVSNILAGLAVAQIFDIELELLRHAVSDLRPAKMRGERSLWRGVEILNDSYNSNPEAAQEMLRLLSAERAGRRIAVLGEMLELGHMSEQLHRDLGAFAAGRVDTVVGVQGAARFLVEEAAASGLPEAFFFEKAELAGDFLKEYVRAGDAILFKGSRGTHVEDALARMES